jgi:Flp pilus assembly protein CpaB
MANLRDKLRDGGKSAKAGDDTRPAESPRKPRGAAARRPRRKSILADLDVDRRMLFAALGVAAIAGLLAVTYLSDLSSGILAGAQKVTVYVPTSDLPARKQLDATMLEAREVPRALVPDKAILEQEKLVGKVLLAPVTKGEILHQLRVGAPSAVTGVGPKLRSTERGFLFVPDGAHDIALVKPDDYVDLTATIQTDGGYLSTKVAQRVRVLSVGNRFSNDALPEGESAYGDLLTLAVPSREVALLAALKEQGNLSLSLREPGDTTVTPPEIPPAELARIVLGRVPARVSTRPVAAPPRTVVVTRQVPVRPPVERPVKPRPRPVQATQPREDRPAGIEIYNGTTLVHRRDGQP